MKKIWFQAAAVWSLTALMYRYVPFGILTAWAGGWELSEDGTYWTYAVSPGNPITDEWFTDEDGREYYLDPKGRMKTGWVTNKEEDCKYYMGEDGAKLYNGFTPDGHYVGPDARILEKFDTYRKAVKKTLKKELKAGKGLEESQLPGFMLVDLNWDGYRDLVIVNCAMQPERVVLAAVWEPDEEELMISAESDYQTSEKSRIVLNPASRTTWLVMEAENGLDKDYFSMSDDDLYFESRWVFRTETNDWGDMEYYVNDEEADPEEWDQSLIQISEEIGTEIPGTYLPLKAERIDPAVDCAPTPEELILWQP